MKSFLLRNRPNTFTMQVFENYPLKKYNTFGLDINARFYAEAVSKEELSELLKNTSPKVNKVFILGGGSNVLFTGDYDGLVIRNRIEKIEKTSEDENHVYLTAGAGLNWHTFVLYAVENNYQGLENLSLIPGCVGAAPIQNIGAYGVEIKDSFQSLTALHLTNYQIHKFDATDCKFGYRDSIFKREAKNNFAILEVTFRLNKNGKLNTSYGAIEDELRKMRIQNPTIRDVSNAVIQIRKSKLPDPREIGNAGSFFKNPEIPVAQFESLAKEYTGIVGYPFGQKVKLAAGWLIEQCGWKGKRVGNVGMHEKQALVLVNYGGASGKELLSHAVQVMESVRQKFGVTLEMEVNIV